MPEKYITPASEAAAVEIGEVTFGKKYELMDWGWFRDNEGDYRIDSWYRDGKMVDWEEPEAEKTMPHIDHEVTITMTYRELIRAMYVAAQTNGKPSGTNIYTTTIDMLQLGSDFHKHFSRFDKAFNSAKSNKPYIDYLSIQEEWESLFPVVQENKVKRKREIEDQIKVLQEELNNL